MPRRNQPLGFRAMPLWVLSLHYQEPGTSGVAQIQSGNLRRGITVTHIGRRSRGDEDPKNLRC
jgi:hypothetical protein